MKPLESRSRLALFLSLLLILWTVRVVLLSPLLNPAEPYAWQDIGNIAMKWLVWVLPIFIVLANKKPLEFLRLRPNVFSRFFVGLLAGLLYGCCVVLFETATGQKTFNVNALLLLPRVLVAAALPEELLFRGYALRKLGTLPFWLVNLLTSLLFLVFHLPGWFYYGLPSVQEIVGVFIVALLAGLLVRQTKSLSGLRCSFTPSTM